MNIDRNDSSRFSIIGIQEIGHKEALGYIVQELNQPTIPTIKDWPNRHQGKWTYTISDVAGRMFQVRESILSVSLLLYRLIRDRNISDSFMMNHKESNVKERHYYRSKSILHVLLLLLSFVFVTNMILSS